MFPPLHAKCSFGQHLRARPSVPDGLQPPGEVLIVANRYLPDSRYPAKSIQSVALVKVHGGSVHHLLAAYSFTQISYRLDRAHTHAAVEPSLKAVATGCQKIARPPVEADAVDKIRGSMGRFQVVLATGVIGIA